MKPLAALAIVSLGLGCSSAVTPSAPPPPGPPPPTITPVSPEPGSATSSSNLLGSLRTRDREVLLYASPDGMKVTVKTSSGAMLADRVDLDTLRTLDPHIYEICRSGVAGRPSYLDATLDPRVRGAESRGDPASAMPRRSRP